MNSSHILFRLYPKNWKQLVPVVTTGPRCQCVSLSQVGVLQDQKTRPVSESMNAAFYSERSDYFQFTSDSSCGNSSTLLLPHCSSPNLRGGKPSLAPPLRYISGKPGRYILVDAARSLYHRNAAYIHKTLVRGFHKTTAKNSELKSTETTLPKKSSVRGASHQQTKDDRSPGLSETPPQETWALETEEEVERLSQRILKSAGQRDVMVQSVPLSQVVPLVLGLYETGGWTPSHILTLLSSNPSLLLIPLRHSLLPTVHHLFSLGFDGQQVRIIVEDLPAVLQTSPTKIAQAMNSLRNLGFGEETVFCVVSHNPSLLLASASALQERVTSLRQMFKSADVVTLVLKCPGLLTDEWKDIQAKFDYVFHEMGVTQKQMVYAALFNHTLSHIKQRHTFLVRAGLFSTAKRKEGERSPNAKLDHIVVTSDREFCRRFGGFGVSEYQAFCQLYNKEQAQAEDSDSDNENLTSK